MSDIKLRSKRNAEEILVDLLLERIGRSNKSYTLKLDITEDRCFKDKWISVGQITLLPERYEASMHEDGSDRRRLLATLRYGFYDWKIPKQSQLIDEISSAFSNTKSANEDQKKTIKRSTEIIAHIAIRCGFAEPVFDALALSRMPFRRPASIVIDTNAVLQGALDFVARHLTPQVRIKVPALVHMEILNMVDRYFTQRRKGKGTASMLLDHLTSQGGQRVLLRLETNQKIEFERPRLGADPLRGVVQPDSDAEDKSLGLQRIQRSFADRLILETAVQHRDQVGPDHPVMLLTSDQGLARMALAEGIDPIFFDSNASSDIFDSTLSGVNFVPFIKDGARFYTCAISDVLWEFATTFGAARLSFPDADISFEVLSLGEDLSWQPYHSYEDLLWTRSFIPDISVKSERQEVVDKSAGIATKKPYKPDVDALQRRTGAYTFKINSMFRLISELCHMGTVTDELAKELINVKTSSPYKEYYNFLAAGQFSIRNSGVLQKKEALDDLFQALRLCDYEKIGNLLSNVPSLKIFLEKLGVGEVLSQEAFKLRDNVFRTYCNLAELCCKGIRIVELGIYGTPYNPTPAEFVKPALAAYDAVRAGENFALTGAWLEYLAKVSKIHPIYARQRLMEAYQGGYLQRFFEGSTPETRFENRNIQVLFIDQGQPLARTINLYHGDFLLEGRSSVSIKLMKGDKQ